MDTLRVYSAAPAHGGGEVQEAERLRPRLLGIAERRTAQSGDQALLRLVAGGGQIVERRPLCCTEVVAHCLGRGDQRASIRPAVSRTAGVLNAVARRSHYVGCGRALP